MLKEANGNSSSSRHVLMYGMIFVGGFFILINVGIGLGWWGYDKWSGSLEWMKWGLLSVIVPYSANKLGRIGG